MPPPLSPMAIDSPWDDDDDFPLDTPPPPPPPPVINRSVPRKPVQEKASSQLQEHKKQSQEPKHPAQKQSTPKIQKQASSSEEDQQNSPQGQPMSSPSIAAPAPVAMVRYPPLPPSILYSDDQITISSLHLTIHAFYFPLNTPVTIPLLSITEVETITSDTGGGGNSGGVAGWLKYKNWGMAALTDIWWARDPRRTATGAFTSASDSSSRSGDKENTPPPVHVVVTVKGEWLRKGFGVQHERGVKVLQDAWKNIKESEVGLKPLRPSAVASDEDDGLAIDKPGCDSTNGGSEKRRWMGQQNTWTAYPFADGSPQFIAQQQRRGGSSILSSKAPRYHQPQRAKTATTAAMHLGEEESCGDEPLFIDNDGNIHEQI
ncbi:hypothetical protein BGZ54_006801 [Gamsiella multidivaricata]|nr:hypothetical protein BGZ54_006801 [Gamsiella multidivaricata]